MLKESRLYVSAIVIAILLVSTFVTPTATKACMPQMPSTLLSLYLESDLIILADYQNEEILSRENEDEDGYYANLHRNLNVIQVFKGQKELKNIAYVDFEYRQINVPSENTENPEDKEFLLMNYWDGIELEAGKRYVFFLSISEEDGKYHLTDSVSGIKDAAKSFDVIEKSIDDLSAIVANEKDQLTNLNQWLVSGLDETETRDDAIRDLYQSFQALGWENDQEPIPFKLNSEFSSYTPEIAKNLTDSQRNRISDLLYESLQQAWFTQSSDEIYVDNRLTSIVSSWNKAQLAVYGFSILQSVDQNESAKKRQIMDFITDVVDDAKLISIFSEYAENIYTMNEKKDTVITPEAKIEFQTLVDARDSLSAQFDDRFQFMYSRNFQTVEEVE